MRAKAASKGPWANGNFNAVAAAALLKSGEYCPQGLQGLQFLAHVENPALCWLSQHRA